VPEIMGSMVVSVKKNLAVVGSTKVDEIQSGRDPSALDHRDDFYA